MNEGPVLISAAGIVTAGAALPTPRAMLIEPAASRAGSWSVCALGSLEEVETHAGAASARRVDRPNEVILPGLVNAHAHLDLTHIGPQPLERADGFAEWGKWITRSRLDDPDELRKSVREGIRRSLAGGVVAVGDIAGAWRTEPIEVLRESGLLGVSFLETFGIGATREAASAQRLRAILDERSDLLAPSQANIGISPHASYSVGPDLYARTADIAQERGILLTTHVGECPEERQVLESGTGPIRDLLEELGLWTDEVESRLRGKGSPVQRVLAAVGGRSILAAHVCDCSDEDIELLARTKSSVAYCPRANDYFQYADAFGPHRYRDMLDAGVNVCLGTDSIVCLPEDESNRISTLDEMRFLYSRDATDPLTLLQMATTNGARALGIDSDLFALQAGRTVGGLIAVEVDPQDLRRGPMAAVLRSTEQPQIAAGACH